VVSNGERLKFTAPVTKTHRKMQKNMKGTAPHAVNALESRRKENRAMRILKYELNLMKNQQTINTGIYCAQPIAVAEQYGKLMLWVEVCENIDESIFAYPNDSGGVFEIDVRIIGTGQSFTKELFGPRYIGTAVMSDGYVWHVYAEINKRGGVIT